MLNELSHLKKIFLESDINSNWYAKGSLLFAEGSPVAGIYFLHQGRIKLFRDEADGKEIIFKISCDGDIIGQRCFFSRTHYGMTAKMIEDSKITFVDKDLLHHFLQQNTNISHDIIKLLGMELEESDNKVSSLMRKNVGERLAEFFLITLENFCDLNDPNRINLHLTREEMASSIGTSPETITRYITQFKDKGYIAEKDQSIYILNYMGLKNHSHSPDKDQSEITPFLP